MGHLINPIAFHLSIFKSWEYCLYVRNIYYSEYLHYILHMRNFLYFYFTKKNLLDQGIVLSHIYIYKYTKILISKIFVYYLDLEKQSSIMFNSFYELYYKYLKLRKFRLPRQYFDIHNSDLFMYVYLFYIIFFQPNSIESSRCEISYTKKFKIYTKYLVLLYNQFLFNKIILTGKQFNIKKNYKNHSNSKFNFKLNKMIAQSDEKNKLIENDIKEFYNNFLSIQKHVKKMFNNFYLKRLKRKNKWVEYNYLIQNINNNLNISFILLYFFIGKKIGFAKFKTYRKFFIKWNSLLHVLFFFQDMSYKQINEFNYSVFYLFLTFWIYINMKLSILKSKFYFRNILYSNFYYWLGKKYYFSFFNILSIYFRNIFSVITKFSFFNFIYYFLSNTDITARFLSRYIGLKLQKGHNLFNIINPLYKELGRLSKIGVKYTSKRLLNSLKITYKRIYKRFLLTSYHQIIYLNSLSYNKVKTFITFDLLECIFCLKQVLLKKKKNSFFIKKYLYLLYSYFNWNLIFYKIINFLNNINLKKFIYNIDIQVYIFFSIYNVSINIPFFYNIKYYKVIWSSLLNFLISFSKIFFNYIYYKYLWLKIVSVQKRLWRKQIENNNIYSIKGYKFAFKGRFSRRQKAKYFWKSGGKVSINTLKSYIDYTFFTVPLRNSAVSIKIWLYRNKELGDYQFILKY